MVRIEKAILLGFSVKGLRMLDPVGFWSYARHDDEHSDGELSQLRLIVGRALGLRHGAKITIWQDITAIPFGADWAAEIERTINQTTFFLPIVTPRFLKSPSCLEEFRAFRRRMEALGYDDLVFPVHYVDVENISPEETVFGDDFAVLRRSQWIDFRPFLDTDYHSPAVKQWAGPLAASILRALRLHRIAEAEARERQEPTEQEVERRERQQEIRRTADEFRRQEQTRRIIEEHLHRIVPEAKQIIEADEREEAEAKHVAKEHNRDEESTRLIAEDSQKQKMLVKETEENHSQNLIGSTTAASNPDLMSVSSMIETSEPLTCEQISIEKQVHWWTARTLMWLIAISIAGVFVALGLRLAFEWRAVPGPERSDLIGACDRLAAAPSDQDRPVQIPGVPFNAINATAAISACQIAFKAASNERRIISQLGRALQADKRFEEAKIYYEKASELGNANAMNNLGWLYDTGQGVTQDYVAAHRWYEKAVNLGNTNAMYNLGVLYTNGQGVTQDYKTARQWFEKAAESSKNLNAPSDFAGRNYPRL